MVRHEVGGYLSTVMISQAEIGEEPQKLYERLRANSKRDEMETGSFSFTLGRSGKQRQLRVPTIRGDHQGSARVVRPVFVAGEDFQSEDPEVPRGRFMPIGNEELDVVDLIDSESHHPNATSRIIITVKPHNVAIVTRSMFACRF